MKGSYIPQMILWPSPCIKIWFAYRYDVIPSRCALGATDWRMQTKGLSHNRVEERERVQLIHGWIRGRQGETLFSELPLYR